MEIFRYFVHYSFIGGDVYGVPVRAHDEIIVALNRPVVTTSDLQTLLRVRAAECAREEMESPDYPQADDIRLESCSPWGGRDTRAYDKYDYVKP